MTKIYDRIPFRNNDTRNNSKYDYKQDQEPVYRFEQLHHYLDIRYSAV